MPFEWSETTFCVEFIRISGIFSLDGETAFCNKGLLAIGENHLLLLKCISSYLDELFFVEMNNVLLVFL